MTPPANRVPTPGIKVIDNTVITDDAFQEAIVRLVALVDGLDGAPYHCACRRYLKLGVSDELRQALATVRQAISQRTGEEPIPETSRFAWLEVD